MAKIVKFSLKALGYEWVEKGQVTVFVGWGAYNWNFIAKSLH